MRFWNTNPFMDITLAKGKGCTVWDDRGRSYLDLLSGTWCSVLGHGHPRWVDAVRRHAAELVHCGGTLQSTGMVKGLAKLGEILPRGLDRAVFLSSGSEAMELALKMVRAATDADEIVVIEGGFYGSTSYALSLSEAGRTLAFLPSGGLVHRLPKPDCSRCPMGCTNGCGDSLPCLEPLEKLKGRGIAAVLFEPVIASAGVLVPRPGYPVRLRALATACGAPLLCNEVTTGLGRTGRWFGCMHGGIVPDLLVMGKVLGAGLPVAAVATTEIIEAACSGKVLHVQSHQNDPFSGALAAEVIAILQEEGLVPRAEITGRYLLERLSSMQSSLPMVREVRGLGAMVGIELQPEDAPRGPRFVQQLLEKGFLVNFQPATRSFRLFPPYVITVPELDRFLEAFAEILSPSGAPGPGPGGRSWS